MKIHYTQEDDVFVVKPAPGFHICIKRDFGYYVKVTDLPQGRYKIDRDYPTQHKYKVLHCKSSSPDYDDLKVGPEFSDDEIFICFNDCLFFINALLAKK